MPGCLHVRWLVVVLLTVASMTKATKTIHRKFEYKHSFKGPHLVQRDGSIPFWEHGGHAIASDESIRITPSLRSKKGHVWGKNKVTFDNWDVEIMFRVNGRGRIGADGLAVWYTTEKGQEGPVFGSNDKWNGLGVFFDSFDNDGQHNNPYVMVMVNDGTMVYDHNTDGQHQQIGGCLRDFRNKPFPVRAKIEYYQNTLTLFVHNGMTNNKEDYELCMRAENVVLPKNGYFGISAATGGLADDHDVASFLTHSLVPPTEVSVGQQVPEEERKKFEEEFEEYQKKLQKAKEEYQKDHPDKHPQDLEDADKYFESQDTRELKMIFDGQNAIHNTIRLLHQRIDEIIGRQERTLSQLTILQTGGGGGAGGHHGQPPTGQPQLPAGGDTIRRYEVDQIINTQKELQNSLQDIRTLVNDISTRSRPGQGGLSGYDGTQHYSDLKNSINSLHQDVKIINSKAPPMPSCPEPPAPNCVTPFYFVSFLIIQILVFLGYSMYRNSKEAAAKKFY